MLLNARQIKHRGLITQTILLAVEYITLPEKNERRSKMDGGPLS